MVKVYNFSAGPAVLPKEVLKKAQEELLDYKGSGMSVMELSHRGKLFQGIIEKAESDLREIMEIPDNYKVLFLQGGASLQFSMLPLNLAKDKKAYYVNSGSWAKKAISEAKKIAPSINAEIIELASSEGDKFTHIPAIPTEKIEKDAAYLHITTNNTIEGTAYFDLPEVDVPLVADMSSNILGVKYDVSKFGVIYAGAQKNIGPAGLTVVIIREDLLNTAPVISSMLDYAIQASNHSLYNTPPTFAIYLSQLVFEWVKSLGGVEVMEKQNREKSAILYDFIDSSQFYTSPVKKEYRSLNNIPFVTPTSELDALFVKEATAQGFESIKGHRSVGGMRASLYNAFEREGVEKLVQFMKEFENRNQ
ncbi:phosphoserine aminotransferase apoenzyme [Pilibacter termitis]|uniref:Phosphoserine aminotransferase n=1 Tax=Pilibacter termitis TaxID=263852 RepID=A0A1T4MPM6_9ENTE|nr:3-phosphoserine/phosphohydroxythreonine transaminase [Pilibacter termitis]SJZ68913.1 phosphoserine aminotransferase apoenzyme [Pilibacter termitis]